MFAKTTSNIALAALLVLCVCAAEIRFATAQPSKSDHVQGAIAEQEARVLAQLEEVKKRYSELRDELQRNIYQVNATREFASTMKMRLDDIKSLDVVCRDLEVNLRKEMAGREGRRAGANTIAKTIEQDLRLCRQSAALQIMQFDVLIKEASSLNRVGCPLLV